MLVDTFLECCLHLLNSPQTKTNRKDQLAKVIATLELLTANMAVALVFLSKYQSNKVNVLDTGDCASMPYYMIVASLMLANKFINDHSYTIKTWHSILSKFLAFDAPLSLWNQLEIHFLAGMDYHLTTKHDPSLWGQLTSVERINGYEIGQLRLAIDPTAAASVCSGGFAQFAPAKPPLQNGLVTPPMQLTTPPKYMAAYSSYDSTPAAGPITPLSQPFIGFLHTPMSQATPHWMAHPWDGLEQPMAKRRKVCPASTMPAAIMPAAIMPTGTMPAATMPAAHLTY